MFYIYGYKIIYFKHLIKSQKSVINKQCIFCRQCCYLQTILFDNISYLYHV